MSTMNNNFLQKNTIASVLNNNNNKSLHLKMQVLQRLLRLLDLSCTFVPDSTEYRLVRSDLHGVE